MSGDLLDGTGHPRHHGYAACSRCGTQRPKAGLRYVGDAPPVCVDREWCSTQAGKPTGLDANRDAT